MNILDRFRLDGKTALITGGGTGIGEAFAIALAEAGADIAIVDVHEEDAKKVCKEVADRGRKALYVVADVKNPKDTEKMVDTVVDEWGKLDIAINNAGIGGWCDLLNLEEDAWDKVIDTNLKGVYLCCKAEARVMIPNKYGKIINMGSMAGHIKVRPQNQCHYDASKGGVIHMTKTIAGELAQHGIRVNSISPGIVITPHYNILTGWQELVDGWVELMPLGRTATVEDMQGAALYLASEVSDYMTGHDMLIDGGYAIW